MAAPREQAAETAGADQTGFSLSGFAAIAALPVTDVERARRFYADKLGLTGTPGAAPGNYLYLCGGAAFALYETARRAPGTRQQMGFSVTDLDSVVRELKVRGVVFTGEIADDERTRSAWFEDSEGNVLMLREIRACPAPGQAANDPLTGGSSRNLPDMSPGPDLGA